MNKTLDTITDFAAEWKPMLGLVFSSFVFLYVLADLFFLRRGSVPTLLLVQFFALALVESLLQVFLLGTRFVLLDWSLPRLAFLHYALTALSFLGMMLAFGWFSPAPGSILIFFLVFSFTYVWLFFAFSVFYRAQRRMLNEGLSRFKETRGA